MMNKIKLLLISIGLAIFLVACGDQEKGKLNNRVVDFWNFKINKNFKNAYPFLSPGWRKSESIETYTLRKLQSKVNWLTVSVKSKKCKTKSLCKVEVSIKYEYRFSGATKQLMVIESAIFENWIMKDNTWYYLPIKKKLSD